MIKLGFKTIKKFNNDFFSIAEIGVNHNGLISNAIQLIDQANKAGFDAVKFQTFNSDIMLKKNTSLVKYQKNMNYKNMKNLLDDVSLSKEEFVKIKNYSDKKKIIFLSTPFDLESAEFLNKIGVPAFKIASGDLDNFILLKKIKSFGKPIILSTGMAEKKEISKTINFLKLKTKNLALLHCISEYPTKTKDSQLSSLNELNRLKYVYGFSDHTIGMEASLAAVAMGSKIIEKHITLDKNMRGPDHKCSLECKDLKIFIETLKDVIKSVNHHKRKITPNEKLTSRLVKKSIYYNENLEKNSLLKEKDLIAMRPRLNGISPSYFKKFIGKKLRKNVKKFEMLKIKHF